MQDHQSPNTLKILYIHGFGSNYHPTKPKIQLLRSLGEVVGVDVDYCKGFDIAFQKVNDAATACDLIVGTSMGGFMASHVGANLGIPFVALNPAVTPKQSLLKHIGSFVDYNGNKKVLDQKTVANYPDFKTVNGCGLILLEAGDKVIDPKHTLRALEDFYDVRMIEGGSHRFDSLSDQIKEIAKFVIVAEMVYGI